MSILFEHNGTNYLLFYYEKNTGHFSIINHTVSFCLRQYALQRAIKKELQKTTTTAIIQRCKTSTYTNACTILSASKCYLISQFIL